AVGGLDNEERAEPVRLLQSEHVGHEVGRDLLVPAQEDRVIELHSHGSHVRHVGSLTIRSTPRSSEPPMTRWPRTTRPPLRRTWPSCLSTRACSPMRSSGLYLAAGCSTSVAVRVRSRHSWLITAPAW